MASSIATAPNNAVSSAGLTQYSGYPQSSSSPYGYMSASTNSQNYSPQVPNTTLRNFGSPGGYSAAGSRPDSPATRDLLSSPYNEVNVSSYPISIGMTSSAPPSLPATSLPSIGQGSSTYASAAYSFTGGSGTQTTQQINSQPQSLPHDHYSPQNTAPSPTPSSYYSGSYPPPPPPPPPKMSSTTPNTSMTNRPLSAGNSSYPPPLIPLQPQPQYRPSYQLPGMGATMRGMAPHGGLYTHHHHPGVPQHLQQDRPFKCDQCPQSFSRNHDLKRHKRIHLAVKPFPCDNCDKSFSRKDALKRHRLVKGCGKAGDHKAQRQLQQQSKQTEYEQRPLLQHQHQQLQLPPRQNGPSSSPISPAGENHVIKAER